MLENYLFSKLTVVIVMKNIKIISNIKFCSTFPFIILKNNEKI